jgi:hypothetical protein
MTQSKSPTRADAIATQIAANLNAMPRFGAMDRMYPPREPPEGARGRLSPLVVHGAAVREWQRVWFNR